jgi:hygromycin-B 7''-O-kinase
VWLPAMRTICARHGLDAEALYAERTGSNVVFRAGAGPWIKLFVPLYPRDHLVEHGGLLAAAAAGLPVPDVLAEGEVEGWHYLVVSHRPGRRIGEVWEDLSRAEQTALAAELGRLLRVLHGADAGGLEPAVASWQAFARAQHAGCVEQQRRAGASPAWVARVRTWAAALEPWPPPADREVLLHADVTDEHVLVAREEGRWAITGLIDFGDAMRGDPHYEFAAPAVFLGMRRPAVQRALLLGYGMAAQDLTPELARRLRAHVLLHRFAALPELLRCCPGVPPTTLEALLEALWDFGG